MVRKYSPFKFVNMRKNEKTRENKKKQVKMQQNQIRFNL